MKNKYTILVAEDTKTVQQVLTVHLKKNNYNVILADNGVQALEKLEKNKIDLIISDVMMPEMDGFVFCKTVKQHETYKNLPFIIVTGQEFLKSKLQGLQYGADKYIYKPYNYIDLISTVKEMLENKSRFKFKHKGVNWYEFQVYKSTELVNEINEIIKNICWENEEFISEVDSIIFSINIIKNKLLEPIKNKLNITFSYKYNSEKIMLKLDGFPKDYLKNKKSVLEEIKHFITNINVNSDYNKILIVKETEKNDIIIKKSSENLKKTTEQTHLGTSNNEKSDKNITETELLAKERQKYENKPTESSDTSEPADTNNASDIEKELEALDSDLKDLNSQLKNMTTGSNIKNTSEISQSKEKKSKEPKEDNEKVDATYSFVLEDDTLYFAYKPAKNGGKKVSIDDIKKEVSKNHYSSVSFQLIKTILEDDRAVKKPVAHNQYKKDYDGSVEMVYENYKSSAYMLIKPPVNTKGKQVSYKYAVEVLEGYEFMNPETKSLREYFTTNKKPEKVLVATGTAPEKGDDESIKYSAFSIFDKKQLYVQKGQLLIYKSPGKIGKAGVDVWGNIIPPLKSGELKIYGTGDVVSDKKKLRYIAGADGNAAFENNKLSIVPDNKTSHKISFNDTYKFFIDASDDIIETEKVASSYLNCSKNMWTGKTVYLYDKNYIMIYEYSKKFNSETENEAISSALTYFDVENTDYIDIETVQASSKGLFGLMKKEAVIQVALKVIDKTSFTNYLNLKIKKYKELFNNLKNDFDNMTEKYQKTEDETEKEKISSDLTKIKSNLKKILDMIQETKKEVEKV